jgi:putative Holliday junction resolvase
MGRIVAIDFGEKRIGLATSDLSKQIAFPFTTILAEKNFELTAQSILKILKDKLPIETFVIGLPLHLDGNPSLMSEKAKAFGEVLGEISSIPVVYYDERLTSKQVENRLKEQQFNRKKRAEASDVLAAQLILESYLNRI